MNGDFNVKITKNIVQLFLGIFIMFLMSGCLPNDKELYVKLVRHDITKKIYIKNDTNVYDGYDKDRKVLQTLERGQEYEVVDVRNGFARLAKRDNNKLESDVWISVDEVEINPTYFVTLVVNTPNSKILLDEKEYVPNIRLSKGVYKVDISAPNYLDKSLELEVNEDIKKEISLDFDEELEKEKLEKEKLEKEKIKKEKQKIKKISKEIKNSIFIDKKQKLMWQDNSASIETKKVWLTEENYDAKKYFNTKGDTAASYCKNLVLASFRDWRLPTKDELKNLSTQKNELKNVTASWYWSATSNNSNSERAWSIYLNNGDGYSDLKNAANNVRCVRNGIR